MFEGIVPIRFGMKAGLVVVGRGVDGGLGTFFPISCLCYGLFDLINNRKAGHNPAIFLVDVICCGLVFLDGLCFRISGLSCLAHF